MGERLLPICLCHTVPYSKQFNSCWGRRLLADGLPKDEFRGTPGEHLFFVERFKHVNDTLLSFLEEYGEKRVESQKLAVVGNSG